MADAGEPAQQSRLVPGERGAQRSDDVLDAGEHQAEHVEVSLDQDDRLLFPDRRLRLVQVVELLPLVEDRRLRRVEVLRLAGDEEPAAEPHGAPAEIVNREQQPRPEAGHHLPVLALRREPGLQQHLVVQAELLHRRQEGAARGRVAEPVLSRGVQRDLAPLEIGPGGPPRPATPAAAG